MVLALPFNQQVVSSAVPTIGYSAEDDIGIIPSDHSLPVRTANTILLNNALAAMHAAGSFTFVDGTSGPVLLPIIFSGKTFYFLPPIKTSTKIGGCIAGTPGSGYEMIDDFSSIGMRTRIVGENELGDTEPVIRVRGNGFAILNMDIYGTRIDSWDADGPRAVACIQMEGGAANNPGRMVVENCGIYEAQYGIQTLAGYWDDSNVWHDDENHADLSHVVNVNFFNVESVFRSQNQQSMMWTFQKIFVETVGNTPPRDTIVFDIIRGGFVIANGVVLNIGKPTVLRIQDFSPNNNSFDINGIYWDRSPFTDRSNYITLVRHTGLVGYKWRIRISGGIGDPDTTRWDKTRLFDSDYDNMPDLSDCYFDIKDIPLDEFTTTTGVPYVIRDVTDGPDYTAMTDTSLSYSFNEMSGTTIYEKRGSGPNGTLNGSVNWVSKSITNATWTPGTVTFTSNGHPFLQGQRIVISGITASVSPTAYNGEFVITSVGLNTFSAVLWDNPGTYTSGGTTNYGALAFTNSSSDYISIAANSGHNLYTNSSIAFWIYLNAYTNGCVISKVGSALSGFRTETSLSRFYLTEGGENKVNFPDFGFTTGAWHHIAVTLSNGLIYKAYLDGTQVATGSMSGGTWLGEAIALRIGAQSSSFFSSGTTSSNMNIDDIRLFPHVLPGTAVTLMYNAGAP